ncbi:hypothetical protein lerEdw1_011851 [Lerista edwardsae]|nr:hypothetical protein lerEdw1_011851 [Lerista edwardsae]
MGLRGWQYLLCSCLFCSVHGITLEPQNVRIHSVNLNSTLLWDPPSFHEENVTYTVQYKTGSNSSENLCIKTNFTECNISEIPIYSACVLRVRTESEKGQSVWVDLSFDPLRDTIIGLPSVGVETTNGGLYIHVKDPVVTRNSSIWPIMYFYGPLIYNMLIWKKGYEGQVRNVTISQNSIILSDLDPVTTYCFKIQAFIYKGNKRGEWTDVSCKSTDDVGKVSCIGNLFCEDPVRLIIIILSVSILFPFCCLMVLRVYRRVKHTYFPSYSLPQHFKEFLGKPSYGSEFLAFPSKGDDRVCEKIIVVSEEQNESEEQPNSGKQQFQRSQGDTPVLKEVGECKPLLTIQIGGNNQLHSQGTYKASTDTLHVTDVNTVAL